MNSCYLSAGSFRFLVLPFPTEGFRFPCGWPTQGIDPPETSLGLSCSTCARCNWGGCLLCCGDWVSFSCDFCAHRSRYPVHHRVSRSGDQTSRSLIKGSFAFILPVFPWPGRLIRLEASLDITPRFPPHCYQ